MKDFIAALQIQPKPDVVSELNVIVAEFRQRFAPANLVENVLGDDLAHFEFRSRQLSRIEAALWNRCMANGDRPVDVRYRTATAFDRISSCLLYTSRCV